MILHVDMDAFYASVEQRERPELRGQPVMVGGRSGRGVVCAASYEARQYGVHSAMPTATAQRLCPHGVFLPSRMSLYAAVSAQIRAIFERYTPLIEPLSLDEAFLDVSGSSALFGSAPAIGRMIQRDILEELRLRASVGVAPNKFVAKIASDLRKPFGFVSVPPEDVLDFLAPLPVERLWGVGKKTLAAFHTRGIRTIGELRRWPVELLAERFGAQGEHFWRLAHGLDDRRVTPDRSAKSISHETTFPEDVGDPAAQRAWLLELADQVGRRLRRSGLRARTVHVKLRFPDFRTLTRSVTLPEPTDQTRSIWMAAVGMWERAVPSPATLRLIGVGVSDIRGPSADRQPTLFDLQDTPQQSAIDRLSDAIKDRFGGNAIRRGEA